MLDLENCKDDFERQLAQIQHQLSTIENMPEEIRTHLLEIQQQLFSIVKLKTTVAVSYTHLDVYKRQTLVNLKLRLIN